MIHFFSFIYKILTNKLIMQILCSEFFFIYDNMKAAHTHTFFHLPYSSLSYSIYSGSRPLLYSVSSLVSKTVTFEKNASLAAATI